MKGNLWTIFVVGALLVASFSLVTGHEDAIQPYEVDNESIRVDYSQPVPVENSNATGYEDDERVYNSSGARLDEGSDYEWNTSSGNVTWYDTNATASGEMATISYTYLNRSQSTRFSAMILQSVFVPGVGILLLIASAGAVLYLITRGTWG